MQQVQVAAIGAGWCGGIRAETLSICEIERGWPEASAGQMAPKILHFLESVVLGQPSMMVGNRQ